MASFRLFAGTEKGTVKGINLDASSFSNLNGIALDWSKGVVALDFDSEDEKKILVGTADGIVGSLCCDESILHEKVRAVPDGESARLLAAAKQDSTLVTCLDNGCLSCWKWNEREGELVCQQSAGSKVSCMRMHRPSSTVATGGQSNNLKLWNVERMDKPIFTAKNVRHDTLDLEVPVWIRSIAFPAGSGDQPLIATGTAYHEIRMYDSRAQRRPVLSFEWGEHPILGLDVTPDNSGFIVANTIGDMAHLDLKTGKLIGSYRGACGSIRQVVCHASQPVVVSCSLDRYIRVHHVQTRNLLREIYVKQRATSVLVSSNDLVADSELQRKRHRVAVESTPAGDDDEDMEGSDGDDNMGDDIWDSMAPADEEVNHVTHPVAMSVVEEEMPEEGEEEEKSKEPPKKKKRRKKKANGTS